MKKSLIWWDIKRIIKKDYKRLLQVSIVITFLFYLLNIFTTIHINFNDISKVITDKIWMYFYINDNGNDDRIYKRIIKIKDQLSEEWLNVKFSSKDDAFNFLEKKIPEVTKNFEKFGIENPLPSTLYITFSNKKEYDLMKKIIIENKDIILNVKDIDRSASLQQQENRSLKILSIVKLLKNGIHFIIIMITLIMIAFTQHTIESFFYDFYKDLQVRKLLWATKKDTNWAFILTMLIMLTSWFVISFIITYTTLSLLNNNILDSLNSNIQINKVLPIFLISYIIFSLIASILWYRKLNKLEKRF